MEHRSWPIDRIARLDASGPDFATAFPHGELHLQTMDGPDEKSEKVRTSPYGGHPCDLLIVVTLWKGFASWQNTPSLSMDECVSRPTISQIFVDHARSYSLLPKSIVIPQLPKSRNQIHYILHPWKLTFPLKRHNSNRKFHLPTINFQRIYSISGGAQVLVSSNTNPSKTSQLFFSPKGLESQQSSCIEMYSDIASAISGPVGWLSASQARLNFRQIWEISNSCRNFHLFWCFFWGYDIYNCETFSQLKSTGDYQLSHHFLWECTKNWQQDQIVWPVAVLFLMAIGAVDDLLLNKLKALFIGTLSHCRVTSLAAIRIFARLPRKYWPTHSWQLIKQLLELNKPPKSRWGAKGAKNGSHVVPHLWCCFRPVLWYF